MGNKQVGEEISHVQCHSLTDIGSILVVASLFRVYLKDKRKVHREDESS